MLIMRLYAVPWHSASPRRPLTRGGRQRLYTAPLIPNEEPGDSGLLRLPGSCLVFPPRRGSTAVRHRWGIISNTSARPSTVILAAPSMVSNWMKGSVNVVSASTVPSAANCLTVTAAPSRLPVRMV